MTEPRRIEGELLYVQGRIKEVVQRGLPEVGWEGDPLLSVSIDRGVGGDLLIRDHAFNPPQIIMRRKMEGMEVLKDFRSLAIRLRDAQFKGKPNGGQTIFDRIEARNTAVQAEQKKVRRATYEEGAEKLAWAFGKALD
jgi:hypothetical protein